MGNVFLISTVVLDTDSVVTLVRMLVSHDRYIIWWVVSYDHFWHTWFLRVNGQNPFHIRSLVTIDCVLATRPSGRVSRGTRVAEQGPIIIIEKIESGVTQRVTQPPRSY